MDESAAPGTRREGFDNQRIVVVPRPQVQVALSEPATRRLLVTDAGYFPQAHGHRRTRPDGAAETIVLFCVAGSGTVRVASESYAVAPLTCVVIPAHRPHEYHAAAEDPWTIWWLHLRGTDMAELSSSGSGHTPTVARLRSIDREIALLDELLSLLERRPSAANLLMASAIAWHFLARVQVAGALPADGSPLQRAMTYLESRIEGTITVGELATIVGVSPSHLTALFRRATGSGPSAYHTSLKMGRARSLLDGTSLTIAQVAHAVGYADPLYFSRQFRRVHGTSPTGYRDQTKG